MDDLNDRQKARIDDELRVWYAKHQHKDMFEMMPAEIAQRAFYGGWCAAMEAKPEPCVPATKNKSRTADELEEK